MVTAQNKMAAINDEETGPKHTRVQPLFDETLLFIFYANKNKKIKYLDCWPKKLWFSTSFLKMSQRKGKHSFQLENTDNIPTVYKRIRVE